MKIWSWSSRAGVVLATAVASVVSVPDALAQPWYESYEKGVDALRAGDFDGAVRSLEGAIQARSEPGRNVRAYGMNFIDYYPYFYLGKAYQGSGNAAKARELFEQSRQLAELTGAPDLRQERAAEIVRIEDAMTPRVAPGDFEATMAAARTLGDNGNLRASQERLRALRQEVSRAADADAYRSRVDEALGCYRHRNCQRPNESGRRPAASRPGNIRRCSDETGAGGADRRHRRSRARSAREAR